MKQDKIYDPGFAIDAADAEAYADFVAIVRQLRRDCPWDREQTHASVKHLLVEETYETLEAIEDEDWDALKKELGDLFLHVVFHSVMAEEERTFDLRDVIEAETEKLVRRHPHVFGDGDAESVTEVLQSWERIKMTEGRKASALEGVPRNLPALLRAYRMQEKAAGVGFDFPERDDAWEKVEEEIHEYRELVDAGASDEARMTEFGDLLFSLVNYARFSGVNPEDALRATNDKFLRRFQHVERRLAQEGTPVHEADLEHMDAMWNEAKAHEA